LAESKAAFAAAVGAFTLVKVGPLASQVVLATSIYNLPGTQATHCFLKKFIKVFPTFPDPFQNIMTLLLSSLLVVSVGLNSTVALYKVIKAPKSFNKEEQSVKI
jgi:hypothetical protein